MNPNYTSDDDLKINEDEEYYLIDGRQVKIYCHFCKSWQILTKKANDALPAGAINYDIFCCKGRCMRPECIEQFEKKEKEIKYVMYPENFMAQRPDIDARQALIYCHQCSTWQPLNMTNYRTLPFGCDSHKIRYYNYPNGRCCRAECEEIFQEKEHWKKFDKRFWAEEAILRARCDELDAKRDAEWKKDI